MVAASSGSKDHGQDTLQCPQCRMASRRALQLTHAKHAYTVFWKSLTRGYPPQYKMFVRTAFMVGIKVPLDSMLHCVADADNGVGRDLLRKWIEYCKVALAWAEIEDQQTVCLSSEIVEMDGSKTLLHKGTSKTQWLKRKPRFPMKISHQTKPTVSAMKSLPTKRGSGKKAVHHGRMLFVRGRFSKASVALPLRPAASCHGAPSPPESAKDVAKALRRHVDAASCVGASDSGAALKSGFKKAKMPAAHARHHLDEMSPLCTLKKKSMTAAQIKTLSKASVGKRPAAIEKKTCFNIVGGDNATEAEVSRTKSQLRRVNALGRQSPRLAHCDQLAARRLLVKPGLLSVLDSMSRYRKSRVRSLGHSPHDFLELSQDASWMFE